MHGYSCQLIPLTTDGLWRNYQRKQHGFHWWLLVEALCWQREIQKVLFNLGPCHSRFQNYRDIHLSCTSSRSCNQISHRLTGLFLINCLALWSSLYGTIDSSILRNSWNIPNCWHCCFSLFSNLSSYLSYGTFEGSNWLLSTMCRYFLIDLNLFLLITLENMGACKSSITDQ